MPSLATAGPRDAAEGRAIPVTSPAPPATSNYGVLRAAAENGSAVAACRIAQEISRCANELDLLEVAELLATVPKLPGQEQSLAEQVLDGTSDSSQRCEGAAAHLEKGYRYQRLAAINGGRAYRKWLVLRPLLDQQDFLADIDDWKDYEIRARTFVSEAISSKSGDDLSLLVSVYAPRRLRIPRPPLQLNDQITFLALAEVARRSGVTLLPPLRSAADDLAGRLTGEQKDAVHRRVLELGPRWVVSDASQSPLDDYGQVLGESFCQ